MEAVCTLDSAWGLLVAHPEEMRLTVRKALPQRDRRRCVD
jgi:hypothetical protein